MKGRVKLASGESPRDRCLCDVTQRCQPFIITRGRNKGAIAFKYAHNNKHYVRFMNTLGGEGWDYYVENNPNSTVRMLDAGEQIIITVG